MKRSRRDFEVMVRGCTEDLYRFAYWLARDPDVAEDLVQETLLRAWRAMDQLEDSGRVRAWMITTLRREHARLYERKGPLESVSLEEVQDCLVQPEPVDVLERSELFKRLWALPTEYREAIVLQVLFGYSLAEIAAILNVSPSTVNNRVFRARQQLQAGAAEKRSRARTGS